MLKKALTKIVIFQILTLIALSVLLYYLYKVRVVENIKYTDVRTDITDNTISKIQAESQTYDSLIQKKENPNFNEEGCLSTTELSHYRHRFMESALQQELGSLSNLEQEVLNAMKEGELISENVDKTVDEQLTFGQRLSDKIADFGGSWTFILSFFFFLALWIAFNIYSLTKSFDPYPFILLNLILSCIAAMQAPVIMMSQNRQEEKDRERSKHDYQVNLKAELEIRMMHEKIDHLILHQQQRLFEIQRIQIEMLQEIHDKLTPPQKQGWHKAFDVNYGKN